MVFEKLKDILLCGYEIEDVTLDSKLNEDYDVDELEYWDIVMDIEEVFEIEFTAEFDYKKVTVGDIVKFIEENI